MMIAVILWALSAVVLSACAMRAKVVDEWADDTSQLDQWDDVTREGE